MKNQEMIEALKNKGFPTECENCAENLPLQDIPMHPDTLAICSTCFQTALERANIGRKGNDFY